MHCTKQELAGALADGRVADVFDELNIAFILYPQWKQDLETKGYFQIHH